jgi:hypothetical protein
MVRAVSSATPSRSAISSVPSPSASSASVSCCRAVSPASTCGASKGPAAPSRYAMPNTPVISPFSRSGADETRTGTRRPAWSSSVIVYSVDDASPITFFANCLRARWTSSGATARTNGCPTRSPTRSIAPRFIHRIRPSRSTTEAGTVNCSSACVTSTSGSRWVMRRSTTQPLPCKRAPAAHRRPSADTPIFRDPRAELRAS